jgi:hypothetical protein
MDKSASALNAVSSKASYRSCGFFINTSYEKVIYKSGCAQCYFLSKPHAKAACLQATCKDILGFKAKHSNHLSLYSVFLYTSHIF